MGHLHLVIPNGTAAKIQQLRVIALLSPTGTSVVPHLKIQVDRQTDIGRDKTKLFLCVTFSLTFETSDMASPMRSALPTRPIL